jgi:hypothetical protein
VLVYIIAWVAVYPLQPLPQSSSFSSTPVHCFGFCLLS